MTEEREEIANCEFCGKAIHDRDLYYSGPGSIYVCEEHAPSLSDAIRQHEEILFRVPWSPGELGYDSRDEMKRALNLMRHELAKSGDRKILAGV